MFGIRTITILSVAAALALAVSEARAADLTLDWYTIDGGGAVWTTGGDFELSGTIGQPDAGPVMSGGDFVLTGGFWTGAAIPPVPCPGDVDGDRDVDLTDLAILLSDFDCTSGCVGDVDDDDDTDLTDLAILLSNFDAICD